MASIEFQDLEAALVNHEGMKFLSSALQTTQDGHELLKVLLRYTHFNSPFAGGMASLAGHIACRHGIFMDSKEKIPCLADRSLEVATNIFFAAIDEFGGAMIDSRFTHHWLARQTISAIVEYFTCEAELLKSSGVLNSRTIDAANQVLAGYRDIEPLDTLRLFWAIGFHIGSEMLATQEFQVLDSYLRSHQSSLVDFLQKKLIHKSHLTAYHWISVHLEAEPKHFEIAMRGANLALHHYVGQENRDVLKGSILKGFNAFAHLHLSFMQALGE